MRITISLALMFAPYVGAQVGTQVAYDYTALYEQLSPSIVKVETDSGSTFRRWNSISRDDGVPAS